MKIYFRIPFTFYWIGKVGLFDPIKQEATGKYYLCIVTKNWDEKESHYYWKIIK